VGGLRTSVFETVLCLQISADLISLLRQRLEEDFSGGAETVRKCLIMFAMHCEGTGTSDLASFQKEVLKTESFQGAKGFLSFSGTITTRTSVASMCFFPILGILPSHSRAHSLR